jgi:hypothetical protein
VISSVSGFLAHAFKGKPSGAYEWYCLAAMIENRALPYDPALSSWSIISSFQNRNSVCYTTE